MEERMTNMEKTNQEQTCKKALIQNKIAESDNGAVYQYNYLPGELFTFSIIKGRRYKDYTNRYKIVAEFVQEPSKKITIGAIRGKKNDAEKLLNKIIRGKS